MSVPTNEEILAVLDRLDTSVADELESYWLEFKPWRGSKESMRVATEVAVSFANGEGGVIVFGVADRTRGRAQAIHGAEGYDIDTWRNSIFASTRPNLAVDVCELTVPEGTGRLLVVRLAQGTSPPYGTAEGLYKRRVGKSCMPLDPQSWARIQVSTGAVDWSGQPAPGVSRQQIDAVEVARARNILTKAVARDLLGKAAYTKTRGLDPIRYAEMVKAFVADHGSISPGECRELLGLGESQSARVQVSRMLGRRLRAPECKWSVNARESLL